MVFVRYWSIAPMLYTVEVKNSGDERWTDVPTIKGIVFGGHDVCEGHESTSGGMGGHGNNAKCSFSENMHGNENSYTIDNIKTDEEGVWKFVFDKAYMLDCEISGPVSVSLNCVKKETTTECFSDLDSPPFPSGTYTIEVDGDSEWTDGIPKITTFFIGNKDYCEGKFLDALE